MSGTLRADQAHTSAVQPADPAWNRVERALRELCGTDRLVIYDVPGTEAPRPCDGSRVFVKRTPAYRRFLDARERLDDGILTLLLSLRPLDDEEAALALDWGNSYANAFLLIQPSVSGCDLTDPANPHRLALRRLAGSPEPNARGALGEALRLLFAEWVTWTPAAPATPAERVPLSIPDRSGTIVPALERAVQRRYAQPAFDAALADLLERERELFGGPVARARIPFLTRLGLPVLHDPLCADRALRRLVNDGRAWVSESGPDPRIFRGPAHPIPDDLTDADFAQLVMR